MKYIKFKNNNKSFSENKTKTKAIWKLFLKQSNSLYQAKFSAL